VLRALVEAFDDPERYRMSPEEIKTVTGFSDDDVHRALRVLHEASPPLIKGTMVSQLSFPVMVMGVTERARVAAGQWPKPEDLVDALARAFEDAAKSGDPQEGSRLRRIAEDLRGAASGCCNSSSHRLDQPDDGTRPLSSQEGVERAANNFREVALRKSAEPPSPRQLLSRIAIAHRQDFS
jgi:hypothetical protein